MSTTDASPTTTCPICYEEAGAILYTLQSCRHVTCRTCLQTWFSNEEKTGQLHPTCPMDDCRALVGQTEASTILGRSFVPAGLSNQNKTPPQQAASTGTNNEDCHQTQQWLKKKALKCGGCQSWITKLSGCNKLQCICGFRVCWKCRTPGARCSCNRGHGFVDNLTGVPVFGASARPVISTREGLVNALKNGAAERAEKDKNRRRFEERLKRLAVSNQSQRFLQMLNTMQDGHAIDIAALASTLAAGTGGTKRNREDTGPRSMTAASTTATTGDALVESKKQKREYHTVSKEGNEIVVID